MRKILVFTVLLVVGGIIGNYMGNRVVNAQATPFNITAQLAHTSCPAAAAGRTQYCFATDGLWQSINGAAYVQLGSSTTAGVSSWNGMTGVVVYTPPAPPVTSVNGKTGSVILAATTSIQ